jgi:hypothetical protein
MCEPLANLEKAMKNKYIKNHSVLNEWYFEELSIRVCS